MKVSVLQSGSGGNCITVQHSGESVLLIEAGISRKQMDRKLQSVGLRSSNINAVICSHVHGDHYAHILKYPIEGMNHDRPWAWGLAHESDDIAVIGELDIYPFPVPHDAPWANAYYISDGKSRLCIVMDCGSITDHMVMSMEGADVLVIACDYDEEMLPNAPYPDYVKKRNASATGHLSTQQLCAFLDHEWDGKAHTIIAVHLSRTANSPERVEHAVKHSLTQRGSSARLIISSFDAPTELTEV